MRRLDDNALAAAAKADEELAAGVDKGPLHGIPIGIKDIISTTDAPSTAQSLILRPGFGAEHGDAPVVARLRAAGAPDLAVASGLRSRHRGTDAHGGGMLP
jgi:aspartyl-tRNA(Asn)/glutamyl-tRNA(Gln) amidotransferase subunit A